MHTYEPPILPEFLARLHAEEQHLGEALASLIDLHAALSAGDLSELTAEQPRQAALATKLTSARADQTVTAKQLAAELGLPDTLPRLTTLAERLPPHAAEQVLAARERLVTLTTQITELHRRNANLAHQLRSYLRTVFAVLTEAAPVRYGPLGVSVTAAGAANAIRASG